MFAVFSPFRKALRRLTLPLTALALAACEPIDLSGFPNSGPSIDASKPVPVALLVPSGSANESDNTLAQSLENAARLAAADLQGATIDLRVYSTAGNPQQAAAQAQQAVDDGARIILGPVYAEAANAAGVAVADEGINVLSFSNNATIAGGNVFVLGPTFNNTAERLISFAARQGKRNIVVVHGNGVAGQLGANAIQAAAAASPVSVVDTVSYPLTQQGVVQAIPQIKDSVAQNGADALFLTAPSASALPLLTQLMPEAGISPIDTQYIGLTRWDIPAQTLALPGVQGGWFAMPDPTRNAAFNGRYQSTYGTAPHPIGALAFDGVAAIGALVSSGKSDALKAASLTQSAGFQGATGIFRLRPDGTNQRGLAVATVQEQQATIIESAPQSFGAAGL